MGLLLAGQAGQQGSIDMPDAVVINACFVFRPDPVGDVGAGAGRKTIACHMGCQIVCCDDLTDPTAFEDVDYRAR